MFPVRSKAAKALLLFLAGSLAIFGAVAIAQSPTGPANVDHATLTAADAPGNVGDWQSYSRTWDEQRFSPLTQINDRNVGQLGLAWYDDLQTQRGVQGSPLVIGGVLYNVSIYNIVTAYDGKTGHKLWTYNPKVANIWRAGPAAAPRRAASRPGRARSISARSMAG